MEHRKSPSVGSEPELSMGWVDPCTGWVGLGRVTDAGFDAPVAAAAAAATRQRLVRASRYIVVRLALMRHSWECEQPLDG